MLMSLLPLVALNFQTPCPEMNLNQGLFLQNGQTGYILKPSYLRDQDTEFDPITLTKGPWLKRKSLHVMASGSPTPFLFSNIWTISLCCSYQLHSFFLNHCYGLPNRWSQPNSYPKWAKGSPPLLIRLWKCRSTVCQPIRPWWKRSTLRIMV